MNTEQTNRKICKMCCEEISAKAKKCPHCQHWQHPLLTFGYSPALVVVPISLFIILFGIMLGTVFHEGEPFQGHENELIIQNSEMLFGENQCGPTVTVLGTIKNTGLLSWKNVNIEIQFFDKHGRMIDGNQKTKYFMGIPAEKEAVFKISMNREFPQDLYKDYTVNIISAEDSRAWP